MPAVTIDQPRPNQRVQSGKPLLITGYATDVGLPEPHTIDSVVVQIDNDRAIRAKLSVVPVPGRKLTRVAFSATAEVQVGRDLHNITATAANDMGKTSSCRVPVFIATSPPDITVNSPRSVPLVRLASPSRMELESIFPNNLDVAAHRWAVQVGFVGGIWNHENDGSHLGVICLTSNAAEWQSPSISELEKIFAGNPDVAAHRWAMQHGYAAGKWSHENDGTHLGVICVKRDAAQLVSPTIAELEKIFAGNPDVAAHRWAMQHGYVAGVWIHENDGTHLGLACFPANQTVAEPMFLDYSSPSLPAVYPLQFVSKPFFAQLRASYRTRPYGQLFVIRHDKRIEIKRVRIQPFDGNLVDCNILQSLIINDTVHELYSHTDLINLDAFLIHNTSILTYGVIADYALKGSSSSYKFLSSQQRKPLFSYGGIFAFSPGRFAISALTPDVQALVDRGSDIRVYLCSHDRESVTITHIEKVGSSGSFRVAALPALPVTLNFGDCLYDYSGDGIVTRLPSFKIESDNSGLNQPGSIRIALQRASDHKELAPLILRVLVDPGS